MRIHRAMGSHQGAPGKAVLSFSVNVCAGLREAQLLGEFIALPEDLSAGPSAHNRL